MDETDAALPKNPPVTRRDDVIGPETSDFAAGVQSAWADYCRTEMPYVIRYLVKCFADTDIHDAYDAAHAAFAELLENWHTIRDPRAVRAWLRTVAFRQMLKQPAREYPMDTTVQHPFVSSAQVHLDLHEQERAVIDALRQLPLAQRQVMALVYDGFSYAASSPASTAPHSGTHRLTSFTKMIPGTRNRCAPVLRPSRRPHQP